MQNFTWVDVDRMITDARGLLRYESLLPRGRQYAQAVVTRGERVLSLMETRPQTSYEMRGHIEDMAHMLSIAKSLLLED